MEYIGKNMGVWPNGCIVSINNNTRAFSSVLEEPVTFCTGHFTFNIRGVGRHYSDLLPKVLAGVCVRVPNMHRYHHRPFAKVFGKEELIKL